MISTQSLTVYLKILIQKNLIWTILSFKDTKLSFLHLQDKLNTFNITQKHRDVQELLRIQTFGQVCFIQSLILIQKPGNQYQISVK